LERFLKYLLYSVSFLLLITAVFGANVHLPLQESQPAQQNQPASPPDTTDPDSTKPAPPGELIYPIPHEDPIFTGQPATSPLYLGDPANLNSAVEYDPTTNRYYFLDKIGDQYYRTPNYLTFEEYLNYDLKNSVNRYFKQRSGEIGADKRNAFLPEIKVGGEAFDRIFGGNTVDIRPSGSAELTFGIISNRRDDPALDVRQRRTTNFDFQEKIQMSLIAKIGDKIEFKTNYNTEATFEFENKLKLKYEGKEDEIIKLIEAGDITMPLNSTLITGSQSLFGLKTKLQFGKTTVTGIFSQQESQTQTINVQGGAQTHEFSLTADQYEENRHFFLAQFYRDSYNKALAELPIINSSVNITKIEVWITNIGPAVTDNRNMVAFADLAEKYPHNPNIHTEPGYPFPANNSNDLMTNLDTAQIRDISTVTKYLTGKGFVSGEDYQKIGNARRLNPTEYSFNSKLGFISLNTTLNSDQTLAVAYQYTVIGFDDIFQVGEFSDRISSPKCLVTKLLKSTNVNTHLPMYKLMMKNVYAIGAYQVMAEDFVLNILYRGNDNGVPTGYLQEGVIKGTPLIKVLNCDNLDPLLNPPSDGVFDFIDFASKVGGTINAINGRVYFPVLEPFGQALRDSLKDAALADKYCYDSLYSLTKNGAQQYPDKNKFIIEGFYKSASGSEISLNAMNVPQGSVKVTAGGIPLSENVDFTVDYTLGRVRILNEGVLNSGTPIKISLENNSMFSVQTKRLWGFHADHRLTKDLNIGATLLNLTERPLTQKVNYGDEPISNTIWGMDFNYQKEVPFITKLIDKLPFYSTKAPSRILFEGEFAHFIPGHSKAVGKSGTSYIDDFEGSKSSIDLKNIGNWFIASTPQGQTDMFPESTPFSGLEYGYNRSLMSWYIIDQLFYSKTGSTQRPPNVSKDEISKNLTRDVLETEVFPNKQSPNNIPMNLPVLNLAFYPSERGPYNYDVDGLPKISAGLNADGTLKVPESRWGGIMRKMETTDFEATNVEYIEFWMMDPFTDDADKENKGQLYIDLGDISEDILKDSKMSFEQGLPTSTDTTNVARTIWGRVPTQTPLVQSFDNDPNARGFQDVGYDGLRTEDERSFFASSYLQKIINLHGAASAAYIRADNDPSADNYHYFRGGDYDQNAQFSSVHERYKLFGQPDGNSPTDQQNPETYPTASTTIPNMEDINKDNTLSEEERYFQYRIDIDSSKMKVGTNYIADKYTAQGIPLANGKTGSVTWYQFKVPISAPDRVIGNIQDFKTIRFMRMFFRGFRSPVVCRMGTLELVRSEWRKYKYQLLAPGEYIPNDVNSETSFDISAVSIEENGKKIPIPYVLPPGIDRESNLGTTTFQQLNEQSMVLKVCNLEDGDARAAYKTTDFDFRKFKRLKMYVHAEKSYGAADESPENTYPTGTLTAFIRLGSDFTENYYEYEVPLTFTPWFTSSSNGGLIWPESNKLEINLDLIVNVKQDRNIAMRQPGSNITSLTPWSQMDGANKITVVGMPSLNDVKTIMIGIRNPKQNAGSSNDDGKEKCAEIWVNELRLTDFDESPGWAATARMNAVLADLGNVVVSGLHSTAGFGSIEMKVNERQKETITSWDIATNLELGKLLPKAAALKIPMHIDYSEHYAKPEYNPLNPDVLFADDLATYATQGEKDSIRKISIDFTKRTNINFVNVRREKTGGGPGATPKFYDISNFDLTYAYSSIFQRNIDIEYDSKKAYRGGLGYNFNTTPKAVRPFSRAAGLNKIKPLKIITDFNFYYLPKLFSFRFDMDRQYSERLMRKKSTGEIVIFPTYIKKWDWTRNYAVMYDLTQSIRIDYRANAAAYIKEPPGAIDKNQPSYQAYKDSVWNQIWSFGTMNNYTQSLDIDYNIPINKLPLLGWLSAQVGYGADYKWISSPVSIQKRVGNSIENGSTKKLMVTANMTTLYNKIGYLKRLGAPASQNKNKPATPPKPVKPPDPNLAKSPKDKSDTTKKDKINYAKIIADGFLKVLISLKNASFNYNKGEGTFIPGFQPIPTLLGNNWSANAPGLPFILGIQPNGPQDFKEFLSNDTVVNTAFSTKMNETMNIRATFEPFTDFKIELTGNRTFTKNFTEYYRADASGSFKHSTPMTMGNFSVSYMTFGTAFGDQQGKKSKAFENLKKYRLEIAFRQAEQNPNYNGAIVDSTGYPLGYGPVSQDVLIPAFLAAYTGRGPSKGTLNSLPNIPMPNWRITYNGLSRIESLKRYFRTVNISHGYRSTYTVGNYATSVLYDEQDGFSSTIDAMGNFIPKYETDVVSINEQFNPLIDLDMTWTNSLLTKIEVRKSRNLSLSFTNNQLTEVLSNEFIVGVGYRFKDVQFAVKSMATGKKTNVKSDLIVKLDFSIKTNKTTLRRLDEDIDQISAGQKVLSINTSAEYMISQRFNVRVFFDKVINNPFISTSFPNSTTNGGVTLRFTLAQ